MYTTDSVLCEETWKNTIGAETIIYGPKSTTIRSGVRVRSLCINYIVHIRAHTHICSHIIFFTHTHVFRGMATGRLIPMNHQTCGRAVLTNLGEMQVVTGWRAPAPPPPPLNNGSVSNARWTCVSARARVWVHRWWIKTDLKTIMKTTNCALRDFNVW